MVDPMAVSTAEWSADWMAAKKVAKMENTTADSRADWKAGLWVGSKVSKTDVPRAGRLAATKVVSLGLQMAVQKVERWAD